MTMRSERGYTVIELMITMAIVVILMVMAIPNLGAMLHAQQVKSAALDVVSTVEFARSEAIKRNALVNVSAPPAGWSAGWSVAPGTASAIRNESALSGITITEANSNTTFQFGGNGRMQQPLSLSFTIKSTVTATNLQPLCVKVGATGRTQTTTGACS